MGITAQLDLMNHRVQLAGLLLLTLLGPRWPHRPRRRPGQPAALSTRRRGKTFAAKVLAADLRVDLHRVAEEPVRMQHLLLAPRTEYVKLERPLTDTEVAGWTT